jgi:hypothetical protein
VEIHKFITVCFLQQRYYRLLLFPCASRLLLQRRYYRLLCPVAYMCVYVLVTLGWVDGVNNPSQGYVGKYRLCP